LLTRLICNGQLGDIQRGIENFDIESLLKWHGKFLKEGAVILNHPTKEGVTCICKSNEIVRNANALFFSEIGNSDVSWVAIQFGSLIDVIIVDGVAYSFNPKGLLPPQVKINNVSRDVISLIESEGFSLSSKKFGGIGVSHERPYHFFYDQFIYAVKLHRRVKESNLKIVSLGKLFFNVKTIDSTINNNVDEVDFYLFPTTVKGMQQNIHAKEQLYNNASYFEGLIHNAVVKFKRTKKNNELVIWLGITGQKRSWNQQVIGYASIINRLANIYEHVHVLFDGYTSFAGESSVNKSDTLVVNDVVAQVNADNFTYDVMVGMDYKSKVSKGLTADVFIANAGTGSLVPLRFCKLKGVLHSNTKLKTFDDVYPVSVFSVDNKYIRDDEADTAKSMDMISYDIGVDVVFDYLLKALGLSKETTEKALNASVFDVVNSEANEVNNKFKNVNNIFNTKRPSFYILRELAILFEKSGDIATALSIMLQAKKLRPDGPLINLKISEYRKRL
jgi:hypothetical protein